MRKVILLLLVVLASCGSRTDSSMAAGEDRAVVAPISELLSNPLEYDSKTVKIEGVISHVCRHSGDKMRVLQDGTDLSIQVMLGEFTGSFDTESEGLRVSLTGLLVTEVTNLDELSAHDEHHDCETTIEAIEAMKAWGLDPDIRTYITLNHYETR